MNQFAPTSSSALAVPVTAAGERAGMRFLDFFTANTPRPTHAPRLCPRGGGILAWCADAGVPSIGARARGACRHLDRGRNARARGTERQAAALRDPSSVRLVRYWPGLAGQPSPLRAGAAPRRRLRANAGARSAEARALLDSIDVSTPADPRDRAPIGLMVYSFARIGTALGMAVEEVYTQNRRLWVRLREKGASATRSRAHHNLEELSNRLSRRCRTARRPKGAARSPAAPASSPASCGRRRTPIR